MTTDELGERANVIPFGKHKGRLIEEVLVDDPAYLQWLAGQDWFRAKFNILHQVIINRGAEPEETPEHNALQVKFLDDDFCLRFLGAVNPDYTKEALREFEAAREENLRHLAKVIEHGRRRLQQSEAEVAEAEQGKLPSYLEHEWPDKSQRQKKIAERLDSKRSEHTKRKTELLRLICLRERVLPSISAVAFDLAREFEVDGVDVVLTVKAVNTGHIQCEGWMHTWPIELYWSEGYWRTRLELELKPVVGDDYPAVLRQMKANGSEVLFVGEYRGRGATQEQFVRTMATAGIRVVFAADVAV